LNWGQLVIRSPVVTSPSESDVCIAVDWSEHSAQEGESMREH
jgi:hypothetical protein